MRTTAAAIGCAFVLLVAVSVHPAWSQEGRRYVGVSFGQAEHLDGCARASVPCNNKVNSWKLFAGYQFNRYFAADLAYTDLGELSGSGPVRGADVTLNTEVTAWDLVGVGSWPVIDRFSLYGKLGLYRAETEVRRTESRIVFAGVFGQFPVTQTTSTSANKKNTDATFGIGARYDITRNFALRAQWQRYQDVGGSEVGQSDIDVLSAGLMYRF